MLRQQPYHLLSKINLENHCAALSLGGKQLHSVQLWRNSASTTCCLWIRHKPQVPRHLKPPSIYHLSGAILRMQTDDVISINLSEKNSTEYLLRARATLMRR